MTQRTENEEVRIIVQIKQEEEVIFIMGVGISALKIVIMIGQVISWTEP